MLFTLFIYFAFTCSLVVNSLVLYNFLTHRRHLDLRMIEKGAVHTHRVKQGAVHAPR